jgi:hypothetical protein
MAGTQNSGCTPGMTPLKPAGATAHDLVGEPAQLQRLADDVGLAAESPLPEAVAEHEHRVLALAHVLLGQKAAAERGVDAEHVE